MKVVKGILTDHTVSNSLPKEVRFFVTTETEPKAGDLFSVWAHSKLSYLKVTDVYEKFEYLKSENNGVDFEHLPLTLNRIDLDAYKATKEKRAKKDRLLACLKERMEEGVRDANIDEMIAKAKGDAKEEIKALKAQIKALDEEGI